jgi:hypothetical protein
VPPALEFPVLRLVFLASRYSAVTEDQGSSTFFLAFVEPHVDVTVEGARGSHLKLRGPADPVNSILMCVPLVQHYHVIVLEDYIFRVLLSASACDEGLILLGSTLAHLLSLGLSSFLHIFLGGMERFLLLQLVEKYSDVPSLHVAKLVTSPYNSLLRVIVNSSDREVSVLRSLVLGKADSHSINRSLTSLVRNLLFNIQFSLSAEESVFDIARRNSVEIKEALNISGDYAVAVFEKFTDQHVGWLLIRREESAFYLMTSVIPQHNGPIFRGRSTRT